MNLNPFDNVPTSVLSIILGCVGKIRIREVCKRWNCTKYTIRSANLCKFRGDVQEEILNNLRGMNVVTMEISGVELRAQCVELLKRIVINKLNLSRYKNLAPGICEDVLRMKCLQTLIMNYCVWEYNNNNNCEVGINLRTLSLAYCKNVDDRMMKVIGRMNMLNVLDLTMCENVTDEGISHLVSCEKLEKLNIPLCGKGISGRTLCVGLRILNVYGCVGFKVKNLVNLVNLQKLNVSCRCEEDLHIVEGLRMLRELRLELDYEGCDEMGVKLDGFVRLGKLGVCGCRIALLDCVNLRELEISMCRIGMETWAMVGGCGVLEKLRIYECRGYDGDMIIFTESMIDQMVLNLGKLRELELRYCCVLNLGRLGEIGKGFLERLFFDSVCRLDGTFLEKFCDLNKVFSHVKTLKEIRVINSDV